ncbi:hypothetical protein BDK51DRAFT_30624, partial [Blyttiomyces helicus]
MIPNRRSRCLLAAVAAATCSAPASAQTIPPRHSAVLAAGPLNLYFIGGDVVIIGDNETSAQLQESASLQSSIVQVSLASQLTSQTPIPASAISTTQLAAHGRACAQTPDRLYCHGGAITLQTSSRQGNFLTSELDSFVFGPSTFNTTAPSLNPIPQLQYHSMTIIGDNGYIFGGSNTSALAGDSFWRFSLTGFPNPTQIIAPGSPSPRNMHCATNLGNDSILIYGGRDSAGVLLSDLFIFNATAGAWTSAPASASLGPVDGAACTAVNGVPYLFGGSGGTTLVSTLFSYNATASAWTADNALGGPSARLWLVVSGGEASGVASDSSFYFYDLLTFRWFVNTVGISMLSPATVVSPSNPSQPPPSVTAAADSSGSSTSFGVIAGASAGGVVVLIVVGWLLWYCTRNKRSSKYAAPSSMSASPPAPAFVASTSPASDPYPSAVATSPQTFGSATGAAHVPESAPIAHVALKVAPSKNVNADPEAAINNEELPPTYHGEILAPKRNSINLGASTAAKVYRGLCTFTPANADEIPCKLGDQIIIRETFPDGWVRAINVSE